MIFDVLDNHALYTGLGNHISAGLDFLLENDLTSLPVGRMEIDGDNLYALVQEYQTKSPEQGVWEAHRRYIDIQYVISGRERMGFASIRTMQLEEYIPERDFQPMSGAGNDLVLFANSFVILYPDDGHMPGMRINAPEKVRKVVLKVKIRE
jgi:YhcH/YjgK/YiaL family protein